jgi:hypothetical protein
MNFLSDEDVRLINQAIAWQKNFRVTGNAQFVNKRDGAALYLPPPPATSNRSPEGVFRMKVTTAAGDDYPKVLFAKLWDGENDPSEDDPEIPLKWHQPHGEGDDIRAYEPRAGRARPTAATT